jgi:hypothetical protein
MNKRPRDLAVEEDEKTVPSDESGWRQPEGRCFKKHSRQYSSDEETVKDRSEEQKSSMFDGLSIPTGSPEDVKSKLTKHHEKYL